MKLLTFTIPCYNSQEYMEHCIKSILPGGEDVEILIVDDGSTDRTAEIADEALRRQEVDECGLDAVDRKILKTIIQTYRGGPVGLETIAAIIGEESVTIEDVYEPYLMQEGFLSRTSRGRCVTGKAYAHLGIRPENGDGEEPVQLTLQDQ